MQGQIAIGSGGLFGVGPGQSVQKIFYLPEAQTDFILAVIAEELGVLGVRALLFLYGLIAYAGLRAAKGARSLYSALIAVGVTALIVSQALLNAFAVLGLAPLTGVPLPFVSYGSSSLIVMLGAMGLLLNVASGAARTCAPCGDTARAQPADCANGRRTAEKPDGDEPSRERIVIAAGGTAGHVVPALAVADALRAEGAEVSFIGGAARRGAARARRRLRAAHDLRRGSQPHQPAARAARARARRAERSCAPARCSGELRPTR